MSLTCIFHALPRRVHNQIRMVSVLVLVLVLTVTVTTLFELLEWQAEASAALRFGFGGCVVDVK